MLNRRIFTIRKKSIVREELMKRHLRKDLKVVRVEARQISGD